MAEGSSPGWGLILAVAAVVALLGVMVVVGVRDWFREADLNRAARQQRDHRNGQP